MSIVLDGTLGIESPAINAGNIVGQVCFFGMTTAPAGFLKANGAAVSRSTYAALFAAIGTTYGAGDGSTTFALPDLRGEFPRGWDDGRGVDSGRSFGTAQGQAIQSHQHQVDSGNTRTVQSGGVGLSTVGSGAANNTGATGGTETRPRNIALLACIKF
jgi:microcystin-dependent protein